MQFALLEHSTDQGTHWDLLIEQPGGETLATWRLSTDPTAATTPIPAQRIQDHRRIYLTFEGPLAGGRGEVRRLDAGKAEWLERTAERTAMRLHGAKLNGEFEIAAREGRMRFSRRE
ncbi:MAG: hypothetical protein HRF50_02000 [Phycisphaerae bacterium]|jgi:hypothetical protein